MPTIDLKKQWKQLYQSSAKDVTFVDAPPLNYLMAKAIRTGRPCLSRQ